ncbi:MAG: NAD(P)-dependent oxidoreductase [Balneolaceae bacterium]|nr:NAD(P)-dependent oxidoreductase [Balneolaceae bacterium]
MSEISTRKVVLLDPGIASPSYERVLFQQHGYDFQVFDGKKGDYHKKLEVASDAVGLLIRFTEIDEHFLQHTPDLKAIARYGVGYDNIDLEACTRHGVRCANVQGYGNHSVSDHALALILATIRQLIPGQHRIYENFSAPPSEDIPELHEMTLGIIGLGRIGGTMAEKAVPLFDSVIASDPYVDQEKFREKGVANVSLDELLRESHVISIHCNLTEETRQMLNEDAFWQMGKRPVVVNTARGGIIQEEALLSALDNDRIRGAGLDVFQTELPEELNRDLVEHPRVIATGHYAWFSSRAQTELQKRTADNLLAMLRGELPGDCLNP